MTPNGLHELLDQHWPAVNEILPVNDDHFAELLIPCRVQGCPGVHVFHLFYERFSKDVDKFVPWQGRRMEWCLGVGLHRSGCCLKVEAEHKGFRLEGRLIHGAEVAGGLKEVSVLLDVVDSASDQINRRRYVKRISEKVCHKISNWAGIPFRLPILVLMVHYLVYVLPIVLEGVLHERSQVKLELIFLYARWYLGLIQVLQT